MKKRFWSVLLVTAMFVAVLSGCGKDSADTSSDSDSAEAVSEDTVVVKCGVKQSHPPFSQTDDNGELVGLEEDIVVEAFNRMDGYEVEFVGFADSPTLFAALQAGNIDFGSGQYVKSEERRELYKFPEQYYTLSPMYLVSRKDDSFQTLEDIAGETLHFVSTSYEKELVSAFNEENPGKEINLVDQSSDVTYADQLQQISTGQRNVELIYQSTYDTLQEELNIENITLADEPAVVEDVYQVFNINVDDAVVTAFDEALKSMYEDGTLGELTKKWTGVDTIEEFKDKIIALD